MIKDEVLERYHMSPLAWYKDRHGDTPATERGFYETFLEQTDHVAAKMAEAVYLGQTVDPKYAAILQYRQEARDAIGALQNGQEEKGC